MTSGGAVVTAEANYRERTYNGFDYQSRMSTCRPQRQERYELGNNPTVCCITGFTRPDDPKRNGYMFAHLEDYRKPLDWYPVSKRAHALLHRRFLEPEKWMRFIAKHYVHGAWFTFLTMDVRDMYRSFDDIYPDGLPLLGETWPEYADELGITHQLFQGFKKAK